MSSGPAALGTFTKTKVAWCRLCHSVRWVLIEWHLNRAVCLTRPADPDTIALLNAVSQYIDRTKANEQ